MARPELALLAAAVAVFAPGTALAQHEGHVMPGMEMPKAPEPAPPPPTPAPAAPEHHGHDMSNMPAMPTMPDSASAGTDLPAGNEPAPPIPTDRAADRVYGPEAMEMGRHHLYGFHGAQKFFHAALNIAEIQFRRGGEGYEWNGEAWYGGDIDRLLLKSEGEGDFDGGVERAEAQILYSHAIDPYFNLQGGVRYDFEPDPSRIYAAVGVEGLAPGFIEVEGSLFLSNKGELMARAEGYYDQRITQRLILQPRAELNFAAQSSREIGVGSGLSDAEIGLRLRYDIRREFAPYVGVQYRRAFGQTRDFLSDEGRDSGGWSALIGLRTWF